MAESIREQILNNIESRLSSILKSNSYNSDMGKRVYRGSRPAISADKAPYVALFTDLEEKTSQYGTMMRSMPVSIEGIDVFGSRSPDKICEMIYADINECMLSEQITIGFDSGGTTIISQDDLILGETSGAHCLAVTVDKTSGAWASGNAAGSVIARRCVGKFQDNEEITIGTDTGVATVNGSPTGQSPEALTTGGLAENIEFEGGRIIMPESQGVVVGAIVVFNIEYKITPGNPYSQSR